MEKPATRKNGDTFDREAVRAVYQAQKPAYEAILQDLQGEVRTLLEKNGFTPTIKFRVKRFEAYFDKLLRVSRRPEGEKQPLITDVIALRIVFPFLEDVNAVERLLSSALEIVEWEHKGGHHSFREFAYDSVHLLVRIDDRRLDGGVPYGAAVCEVQLRTILQDAWAEVEHELIYKSDISLPNESIKRKLASLNATLTLSDLIFQEIRDYQKEIRSRDRKRRQSLEATLSGERCISITPPPFPDLHPASTAETPLLSGGVSLEKAMLEALRAHSNDELERAVGLYSQILRMKLTDPVRSLVYNHRGMAYFALSDYRRSLKDFSRALDLDDENVRCLNNRALTYRVLKRFHDSLQEYDRSLAINPSQFDAFWGRAQTCYELQLFTQALEDCHRALGIQPGFAPAQALVRRIGNRVF
ncbi:hypothetical protein DSOUD_2508 [Desulfuromonas soudanensis]|uniref:RelA/SpoT domain-containing protein n=1 Tax=Desulfuromonas soudanensis TaxID=1603606 RepID=A0A0M5INZ7_9BACT|nr:RelA/SpoT domain-containing protein [Desulfuromonas soudanensis]ALC17261.1 hypothetical protein DSOUD_2508 [Desulfuromonas soudanensis]